MVDAVDPLPFPCERQNAPICNLPEDVLWHVFFLNTTSPIASLKSAFEDLISSSHVCLAWRTLINSSPSLWSRAIDWDYFRRADIRDEIMPRTGDALLNIRVNCYPYRYESPAESVFTFLLEHWARIQTLELSIIYYSHLSSNKLEDDLWHLIGRPAPSLQNFQLKINSRYTNTGWPPAIPEGHVLFGDQAPVLEKIASPITIRLTSPWLAHIRDLSLCGSLPVEEFLEALKSMSCLETLRDSNNSLTSADRSLHLPAISHPTLNRITLVVQSNVEPYVQFLSHLSISPKCTLDVAVHALSRHAWEQEHWDLTDELVRLFPKFCDLTQAQSAVLSLDSYRFAFSALAPNRVISSFEFLHQMRPPTAEGRMHTPPFFQHFLQSSPLPNLRHLIFIAAPCHGLLAFDQACFDYVKSVEVLHTTTSCIQCITDLLAADTSLVMFPALRELHLQSLPEKADIPSMKFFLASRKSIGEPFNTLVMRKTSYILGNKKRTVDLRWLDRFTGLKVVFQSGRGDEESEYICGKSDVKELAKVPVNND
ncbi:hypothetical protein CVT26_002975 [Gymnopilus dilepis]|uniref:F-box domain-containing protein n=1 Tax=Gymnopilus dilepis TaxID=231916 RepID=A0A409Y4J7_9AGAR|nr:hypothetical protein CVT26_002975 [Gymnopilus dilepis]